MNRGYIASKSGHSLPGKRPKITLGFLAFTQNIRSIVVGTVTKTNDE